MNGSPRIPAWRLHLGRRVRQSLRVPLLLAGLVDGFDAIGYALTRAPLDWGLVVFINVAMVGIALLLLLAHPYSLTSQPALPPRAVRLRAALGWALFLVLTPILLRVGFGLKTDLSSPNGRAFAAMAVWAGAWTFLVWYFLPGPPSLPRPPRPAKRDVRA